MASAKKASEDKVVKKPAAKKPVKAPVTPVAAKKPVAAPKAKPAAKATPKAPVKATAKPVAKRAAAKKPQKEQVDLSVFFASLVGGKLSPEHRAKLAEEAKRRKVTITALSAAILAAFIAQL